VEEKCATPDQRSGVGVMPLRPNARLFASGNFHTKIPGGEQRPDERDLVYVSSQKRPGGAHRYVLTTLLTTSNGCFDTPKISNVFLGENPSLIVVGNFNDDTKDDVAIIDTPVDVDPPNPTPVLRIFLGDDEGTFKEGDGVSTLALEPGEAPVSMVVGRFRGPRSPIDIAIASVPKNPESPSVLRVLVNNGRGEFDKSQLRPTFFKDFKPGLMLVDNRFRQGARYDIVIREEAGPSPKPAKLLYLRNSGDGNFPDVIALKNAGNINSLLAGVLSNQGTGGDRLDIITFDDDMRLKVFVNDGDGRRFTRRDDPALNPHIGHYTFGTQYLTGLKQFLVIEPRTRAVRLAAFATRARDGKQGILLLTADNRGGFEPPHFRSAVALRFPAGIMPTHNAIYDSDPRIHRSIKLLDPENGFVGAFRAGGGSAFVLVARQLERETKKGPCPQSSEMSVLSRAPLGPGLLCPWGDCCRPGTGCDVDRYSCDPPLKCPVGTPVCKELPVRDRGRITCPCHCLLPDSTACMLTKTFPAVGDPPVLIMFGLM
jgi:hypothetical protein